MITQVCQYLKNWFELSVITGTFVINDGVITDEGGGDLGLLPGQYFRVIGSVFNDGVHKNDAAHSDLEDETFSGAVWLMGIPKAVLLLVADITAWQAEYGKVDSQAMSPFTSESFGGYSYSKSTGGSSGGGSATSWQGVFASRLAPWRKI